MIEAPESDLLRPAGPSQEEVVRRYIQNQEQHHRKVSFQDEFRKFLERYKVPYDEKYVWD